jgi:hypothetical protein
MPPRATPVSAPAKPIFGEAIFGEAMARKPNYRFERVERERRKAERQALRDQRKAQSRDDPAALSEPPAGESADPGKSDG